MFYTIATVLAIMWLLAVITGYTAGGFIHILLVVSNILVLLRLIGAEEE